MATTTIQRTLKTFSRREIEGLIANGRAIVIVDGNVLKLDAWLPYHPGGDKALRHMIGRDATDEVQRFHSPQTLELSKRYRIGRIEGTWINFLPPIQGGNFRKMEELEADDEGSDNGAVAVEDITSSASSSDPSPVFEPADRATSSVRQRTTSGMLSRSPSASSLSSMELEDPKRTKMSVLDARTQQEIDLDKATYPSLDPETQARITQKYRELHERIVREGLYDCRYSSYGIECLRYAFFLGAFIFFLKIGWYVPSAVFLGILWHQLAFTVHDASHMGVTHNFQIDSTIAMFVASYCGGLSACWWKSNHNVHHLVTNSTEHDPDIQHLPFFAISHRFFENLYSTYYERVLEYDAFAQLMMKAQDKLYYIILCFGRFNLYRLGWMYLLGPNAPRKGPAWWHRYFELVGQVVFWAWYGYGVLGSIPGGWNKFTFLMISHAVTMPLHVQITLSHFAMSTADLGPAESFAQKMLRTTMDVDCPQWLDFFHGGLQFQAIHHLYPRIPRHNLRRTQKLVQEFCEEVDIPYALYGFVEGNKIVIGKLADVGRQAAILAECQRTIKEEGMMH